MEETLGKRIVASRKRLGLTQDQLAERLGVTAQAVSKWENDQSCPDISMLPKLAEIFGISVDALLGISPTEPAREAALVVQEENEADDPHAQKGKWEFSYDADRKSILHLALLILLIGGILLISMLLGRDVSFGSIVWPSALLVFGLFGLYPRFSVFRLGCTLFGSYFLLENTGITSFGLSGKLVLPICLLLFGLSLLIDALHRPKHASFSVTHNGKTCSSNGKKHRSSFQTDAESFSCSTAFGEDTQYIQLPRLRGGEASVSFGELTVDLSGVEELAENCRIEADCSFGELQLLIPRCWRAEYNSSTTFASVDIQGHPDPESQGVIYLENNVSFGQITIRYV